MSPELHCNATLAGNNLAELKSGHYQHQAAVVILPIGERHFEFHNTCAHPGYVPNIGIGSTRVMAHLAQRACHRRKATSLIAVEHNVSRRVIDF